MVKYKHIKRLPHFYEQIYFITAVTKGRYPFFKNEKLCQLFLLEIIFAKNLKEFELYNFCIMHEHVHLLIKSSKHSNISDDIGFIKKHFSRNANIMLGYQEKNNSKSNLGNLKYNEIDSFVDKNREVRRLNIPKFIWQKSFHDHCIRNYIDFKNHNNYIATNHLKHNLDSEWRYVGFNFPEIIDLS